MITPRETVLDRIEDSFNLLKNNIKELFLPLFLFQFITMVVIYNILSAILFSMFNFWWDISSSSWIMDSFWKLYMDPMFILFITVVIFMVLAYLTIFIPFLVSVIRWISLAYKWEKLDMMENIKYWFMNFSASFQTYWYIFAYIALIPSLIIIIWWLWVIYGQSFWNNSIMNGSFYIVWIWAFYLMINSIIRWLKSTFALYWAIDKGEFTKENFNSTIKVTKNNWWRIWWNLFLLWFIISLASWIFSGIIWVISWIWSGFSISDLASIKKPEDVTALMENIGNTTIFSLIWDTLNLVISVASWIFTYTFTYILYKRLELEYSNENTKSSIHGEVFENEKNNKEEKIEL